MVHFTKENKHLWEPITDLLEDLSTQDISEETETYLLNLVEDIKEGQMDMGTISFSLGNLLWKLENKK